MKKADASLTALTTLPCPGTDKRQGANETRSIVTRRNGGNALRAKNEPAVRQQPDDRYYCLSVHPPGRCPIYRRNCLARRRRGALVPRRAPLPEAPPPSVYRSVVVVEKREPGRKKSDVIGGDCARPTRAARSMALREAGPVVCSGARRCARPTWGEQSSRPLGSPVRGASEREKSGHRRAPGASPARRRAGCQSGDPVATLLMSDGYRTGPGTEIERILSRQLDAENTTSELLITPITNCRITTTTSARSSCARCR